MLRAIAFIGAMIVITSANSAVAAAEFRISFVEGAPKDRFIIENRADCPVAPLDLEIDMTRSVGRLVFDTKPGGSGVQVFQPLEVETGGQWLVRQPMLQDGEKVLALSLAEMPASARIVLTVDVDDTLGQREITVNGSEMSGTTVSNPKDPNGSGVFGQSNVVDLRTGVCSDSG